MRKLAIQGASASAKTAPRKPATSPKEGTESAASRLIDTRIEELNDRRGETLAGARSHQEADPDAVEDWKRRGVPVWSHGGIRCTGETIRPS
jgi:hypothetical protein